MGNDLGISWAPSFPNHQVKIILIRWKVIGPIESLEMILRANHHGWGIITLKGQRNFSAMIKSQQLQTAGSKVHRNSKSRRISDVNPPFLKLVCARKSQETARPKRKMAYFNLEISKMWVNSTLKNRVCRCLPKHLFIYTCPWYTFSQCLDNLTQSCTGESSSRGIHEIMVMTTSHRLTAFVVLSLFDWPGLKLMQ